MEDGGYKMSLFTPSLLLVQVELYTLDILDDELDDEVPPPDLAGDVRVGGHLGAAAGHGGPHHRGQRAGRHLVVLAVPRHLPQVGQVVDQGGPATPVSLASRYTKYSEKMPSP